MRYENDPSEILVVCEGDSNAESIGVTSVTIDRLLREPESANLIALYVFYSYTARWQKTSTIKAVNSYAAKGLDWSVRKVAMYRKQLTELKLVSAIRKSGTNGSTEGWYVRVNYLVKGKSATDCVLPSNGARVQKTHTVGNLHTNTLVQLELNTNRSNKAEAVVIPDNLRTEQFEAAWCDWIMHRKEIKSPAGATACKLQLRKLSDWGELRAVKAIVHSVSNGWTGIYEEKTNGSGQKPSDPPGTYRDVNHKLRKS